MYWNDTLITGLSEIDDPSRNLVEGFEHLIAVSIKGECRKIHKEQMTIIYANIIDIFRTEHDIMIHYDYPQQEYHMELHAHFVAETSCLIKDMELSFNNEALSKKFHKPTDWLVNHINDEDRKLSAHILECRRLSQSDSNSRP